MDKSDARLIYEAAQAVAGVANYTHCGPSTQAIDFIDDAKDVIAQHYSQTNIIQYKAILKKYGLNEEAEKLNIFYEKLEEIAKGNIKNIY